MHERNTAVPLRWDLLYHHGLVGDCSLILDPSIGEIRWQDPESCCHVADGLQSLKVFLTQSERWKNTQKTSIFLSHLKMFPMGNLIFFKPSLIFIFLTCVILPFSLRVFLSFSPALTDSNHNYCDNKAAIIILFIFKILHSSSAFSILFICLLKVGNLI